MSFGMRGVARTMAAWTSAAAESSLREVANCSVTDVLPSELDEVIESSPSMVENSRSSGVATDAAIVSGLAPGSDACTRMVGKSTFGSALTGRRKYARMPNSRIPTITSVVATGRLMNKPEMFTAFPRVLARASARRRCSTSPAWRGPAARSS